jgi:hypothetical protein
MRALIVVASVGGILAAANAAQAQARFGGERSGAWCLFDDPYTYNCGFATLQQCRATASGAGGFCQPNPSGPPAAARAPATPPPKRSPRDR